jgi:hypothetical protein
MPDYTLLLDFGLIMLANLDMAVQEWNRAGGRLIIMLRTAWPRQMVPMLQQDKLTLKSYYISKRGNLHSNVAIEILAFIKLHLLTKSIDFSLV